MFGYTCMIKSEDRFDHEALLAEFEAAAPVLTPNYAGIDTWTTFRAYDPPAVDSMARFPRLMALIEERIGFANVTRVTMARMAPGGDLHEHRDQEGNLLFGIMRLHLPLKTNPKATLKVEGIRRHIPVGEIWALDTSGLHTARNEGDEGRIHIIIDVRRSPQTERFFPRRTPGVYAHLGCVAMIAATKVARDMIKRPSTLLLRLKKLRRQVAPSAQPLG